ncbi:lysosomal amino acid transporter 1 homolog [Thalassophryne amazonica]|uniref:lysosomal amino acid transporter 1 homolog n=1 Tax=Thalassophryne amazonica TaxID=390379 RepID=UPI001471933D|nr:lysosomal amino acid transporter 1 homolog [Thalassophryne amazonica]
MLNASSCINSKLWYSLFSDRQILHVLGVACVLSFTSTLVCLPGSSTQENTILPGFKGRTLLSVTDAGPVKKFTSKEIIGFSIGSISSLLYLCSRVPQIYTNYKRKSTEGVSYFLFALVILGNITYGSSVLLKNPERGQSEASYVVHHLPWLIGSLGTFLLDLTISMQFIRYQRRPQQSDISDEESTSLITDST